MLYNLDIMRCRYSFSSYIKETFSEKILADCLAVMTDQTDKIGGRRRQRPRIEKIRPIRIIGAVVEFIADTSIVSEKGGPESKIWVSIKYSINLRTEGDYLVCLDSVIQESRPDSLKHYDEYLLPILDEESIEQLVAEMYKSCYQGDWDLFSKPKLTDLCDRLGTSQVFVDLPDARDVFGITFFRDSEIEVKEGRKRETRAFKEGTLILTNRFPKRSRGAQFFAFGHELAHWRFHRAAYEFARIAGGLTDFGIICEDDDTNNLYSTIDRKIEKQADSIGAVICAPGPYVEKLVSEKLRKSGMSIESLTADELQGLAQEIAHETGLSREAATIRLKERGYKWNKGINIYIDGRWIDPVNVTSLELNWDETIAITEKQFAGLLFESSHLFNEIVQGRFIYADSHVVIRDPRYVQFSETEGFHVTEYAREHPEECMLRFRVETSMRLGAYSGPHASRLYKRWIPRGDQEVHYVESDNVDVEKAAEEFKFWEQEDEKLSGCIVKNSFSSSLDNLMRETKTSNEYLADLLGFEDPKTIQRYRNAAASKRVPDRNFVISICFALRLSLRCASSLLETCGYTLFRDNQADQLCITLIVRHIGYENAKAILRECGHSNLL